MIAKNFLKYAEAMALQFPLPFDQALVWALPRPGRRVLRRHRAARAQALRAGGRIRRLGRSAVPLWWTAMKQRARLLSLAVKRAMRGLDFEASSRAPPLGGGAKQSGDV